MRPEHFHYLLEINRYHSISSAARALHLSQTTLSSIVKSAEAELGFPIFQRAPNGVTTTAEGERLMALAWEIDVKYEALLSLKTRENSQTQPITVLMSPSVNVGLAIPLSKQFYRFELHGNLAFEEWPGLEIGPRILQNTANVGVSYLSASELESFQKEADKHTVHVEPLFPDRFYLLVGSEHPLARREAVNISEVKDERLAIVTRFCANTGDLLWRELFRSCAQMVSYPNIFTMKQAVRTQGMVGILTGYSIHADSGTAGEGLCTIPIHMNFAVNQISIYLIHREDRSLRYQERILVTCIKEYFQEVSHEAGAFGLPDRD